MYPIVLETTLPHLQIFERTPFWDMYQLNDRLLLVALDRIAWNGQTIKTGIPWKGLMTVQILEKIFDLLRDQIPTFFITSDLNRMSSVFQSTPALLEGRSFLVKKTSLIPLECEIVRYAFHPFFKKRAKYMDPSEKILADSIEYGQPFPSPILLLKGRKRSGKLSYLTSGQMAEIVGDKIAEDMRRLSLQTFTILEDFFKSKELYLAKVKLKWGFHNGQLLLSHLLFNGEEMVLWDQVPGADGRLTFPPSFEKSPVESYFRSHPSASDNFILPEEVKKEVFRRYQWLYEKITDKKLDLEA